MGVLKWLRRERVTLTSHRNIGPEANRSDFNGSQSEANVAGTIRTEEYKRDLAEFQARRQSGTTEARVLPDTPVKKRCGRHSLPVSCTDCALDKTFNLEKKSATKYKKKTHKRTKSVPNEKDSLPNIQFLFQNQVFMPGNVFAHGTYTEPCKKHYSRVERGEKEWCAQKHIDFKEDDEVDAPTPLFYKNNSLPYDVATFLDGHDGDDTGPKYSEVIQSSQSSSDEVQNDSCRDKLLEVMDELKSLDKWADQQLNSQSANSSKIEGNDKSDASAYGLPVVSSSDLDVTIDRNKTWSYGSWGVVPVQVKRLSGVTLEHVRKKRNTEINILRKCRHPNVILLMAVYPVVDNLYIVCESCVDSLFGILHIQGRILSAQTAVQYACDVINALVFLRMRGYIHTALNSHCIMINSRDTAKLADCGPCALVPVHKQQEERSYVTLPHYVNIGDAHPSSTNLDSQPLLSAHSSDTYLDSHSVSKPYKLYRDSPHYRWHAPELFEPQDDIVRPCDKTDVYSLSVVLWESCNAKIPWKTVSYDKLQDQYLMWKSGIRLPSDGSYPGCLLDLLKVGLNIDRESRVGVEKFAAMLTKVKKTLDNMEYIVIPARITKKCSNFSSVAWDNASPTDSDTRSPPQNYVHNAVIHQSVESCTESDKESRSDISPHYETIPKQKLRTPEKCFISEDETDEIFNMYEKIKDIERSSACSTPIAKSRAKKARPIPAPMNKTDSTEYCSILSPGRRISFESVELNSTEKPTAKLSKCFTPKSYKPLHIKVPEINVDGLKTLPKRDTPVCGKPSYHFNIRNYSLPTTPIARSNKLRKNAWLSGELIEGDDDNQPVKLSEAVKEVRSAPETPAVSTVFSTDKKTNREDHIPKRNSLKEQNSPDSFTTLRRITDPLQEFHTSIESRERTHSWSFRTSERSPKTKDSAEDALANVSVKPLVAIHEKWIYEANKKTTRSMSLPENSRHQISAMKPASHLDALPKSLPQLNMKKPVKFFKSFTMSQGTKPGCGGGGGASAQFEAARATLARCLARGDAGDRRTHHNTKLPPPIPAPPPPPTKVDQTTDTSSIEQFMRDLIKEELQSLLHEMSLDTSDRGSRDILNKGVNNVIESLKHSDMLKKDTRNSEPETPTKNSKPNFSRIKINGNNKPLMQITINRNGENILQVLDNCVNVKVGDGNKDRLNQSLDESGDVPQNSLKRCHTYGAIQEVRSSTEDLYIDDDLSFHMQENFGGKVKLIPLHGSLHEILCEREDECCLIKVKQENGCDTIYFRCDNSDTESRDQTDGEMPQDTVVYKRSISLVEERIKRVYPKDKRNKTPPVVKKVTRPKSEVIVKKLNHETRVLSHSSPSLNTRNDCDEVELNVEDVVYYEDTSSDECLQCQDEDEFETLEREIEQDVASNNALCKCLNKISEENLSIIAEETSEKDTGSDSDAKAASR